MRAHQGVPSGNRAALGEGAAVDIAFIADHYMKMFVGLLAMADPLTTAILFLSMASGYSVSERNKIAFLGTLATFAILGLFLLFGLSVLHFFGITLAAFKVMGGIVLLVLGLDMLRDDGSAKEDGKTAGAPTESWATFAVVPLAMPIIAGPGAITTVVIFGNLDENPIHKPLVALVILAICALTYLALIFADQIKRVMRETGITIFHKIMAMLIIAIAVELVFDGTAAHFPGIETIHHLEGRSWHRAPHPRAHIDLACASVKCTLSAGECDDEPVCRYPRRGADRA